MLDAGAGDIEDARHDFIFSPVDVGMTMAGSNIVDFITVFAVVMVRNGIVKGAVFDIGNMKNKASQSKTEISVFCIFWHEGSLLVSRYLKRHFCQYTIETGLPQQDIRECDMGGRYVSYPPLHFLTAQIIIKISSDYLSF